jgi:hypothetical protein
MMNIPTRGKRKVVADMDIIEKVFKDAGVRKLEDN